jgi:hypothetical protein
MIDSYENISKQLDTSIADKYPFTWEIEKFMRRSGKLKVPDGYCHIPAWQQVSVDCAAVSTAAVIQKSIVKAIKYYGFKYPILQPHPAWFYAVARNEIDKGVLSINPGCSIESIVKVIDQYGILWMVEGIPPYNLEVLNAWADSIHYKKAGLSPSMYSHYFERFLPVARKMPELVMVKLQSSLEVVSMLNGGGTIVIESDMPFEPQETSNRQKVLTCVKRQWERHTTYITDIDNKSKSVARWQVWGDSGENGEYKSKHESDPSGMAWQSFDLLNTEFSKYKAKAYGFLIFS